MKHKEIINILHQTNVRTMVPTTKWWKHMRSSPWSFATYLSSQRNICRCVSQETCAYVYFLHEKHVHNVKWWFFIAKIPHEHVMFVPGHNYFIRCNISNINITKIISLKHMESSSRYTCTYPPKIMHPLSNGSNSYYVFYMSLFTSHLP